MDMAGSTPINNVFFEGMYQDVWRKLIPQGLSEAEVDFIFEVGNLKAGEKVLDLMCGYGRHSLEMARRGLNVTAIDSLPAYISEISRNAKEEQLNVNAITGNILEAEWMKFLIRSSAWETVLLFSTGKKL
jgi:2-polyprenyl-3-methyl-5-hydroxy-6-metoxy-1,4-benzoquinol methylase